MLGSTPFSVVGAARSTEVTVVAVAVLVGADLDELLIQSPARGAVAGVRGLLSEDRVPCAFGLGAGVVLQRHLVEAGQAAQRCFEVRQDVPVLGERSLGAWAEDDDLASGSERT